jgi:hypothetical protein
MSGPELAEVGLIGRRHVQLIRYIRWRRRGDARGFLEARG